MEHITNMVVGMKLAGKRFLKEEDGVGVVEIILILVILVGLVLIFKQQIGDVVSKALSSFAKDSNNILK